MVLDSLPPSLVPSEHKQLYRHNQRLNTYDDGVNYSYCCHCMIKQSVHAADLTRLEQYMVITVGVSNALTARHYAFHTIVIERLHHDGQCAGPGGLLCVLKIIRGPQLTCSHYRLYSSYHHGYYFKRA